MSKVYIGIGSNLGDRQLNIDKALEKLKTRKNIQLDEASSVIETEPAGGIKQPKFLNTCCRIDTTLYPDELLSALKSIEREMGRDRGSVPKKLSVEERLKALDDGGNTQAMSGDKRELVNNSEDENKNSPRVIDLDILLYDDIIMKGNNLIIPHRFLHERIFVLEPLSQIAPDIIHPVFKKSINDLYKEFNDNIKE
jgi:2-amino-4-hydroxy-6-hydroxymethyldihydropteridine diphosphokinase